MPFDTPEERRKKGLARGAGGRIVKVGNSPLTAKKAKKILSDGEVGGKELSGKQKRFFGLIAGGGRPTRLMSRLKRRRASRS